MWKSLLTLWSVAIYLNKQSVATSLSQMLLNSSVLNVIVLKMKQIDMKNDTFEALNSDFSFLPHFEKMRDWNDL